MSVGLGKTEFEQSRQCGSGMRDRSLTEQTLGQARVKLASTAIPPPNDWLIDRADTDGYIRRWLGLRLVDAYASTLPLGLRASHESPAASSDQILFGFCLPGANLILAATLSQPQ